jgi:microsomal dipeptidase-like Zn-dependent dipeptidase
VHGDVRAGVRVRGRGGLGEAPARRDGRRRAGPPRRVRLEGVRRRLGRPPCPRATLADVVAHVEHAREVAGIDHIGLGGDYDGTAQLPTGLEDVSSYPALFAALLQRGWSEQDCAKLAGRNALRVLRAVDEVAAP